MFGGDVFFLSYIKGVVTKLLMVMTVNLEIQKKNWEMSMWLTSLRSAAGNDNGLSSKFSKGPYIYFTFAGEPETTWCYLEILTPPLPL